MFDSVKEGKRYEELKFLEKQGKVSGDGYYKKINVKYNKQIICSRTDI